MSFASYIKLIFKLLCFLLVCHYVYVFLLHVRMLVCSSFSHFIASFACNVFSVVLISSIVFAFATPVGE